MKFIRLIADSGGTKTDWCAVDEQKQLHRFTTESYHPQGVDEDFISRQVEFWKKYDISTCFLHFYGAGCLREENQMKMKAFFSHIGFSDVLVESDLYLASRAVDNENTMIAICGTGSLLFKVEHEQLVELRGGLGWETGDEGSGFYFGKLLLERLRENENNYQEIRDRINEWKPLEELYAMYNSSESKSMYSQLSVLFQKSNNHPLIASVHLENIQLFLSIYAGDCSSIGFVGSYAYHLQDFFSFACRQRTIEPFIFIERPMEKIIQKILSN